MNEVFTTKNLWAEPCTGVWHVYLRGPNRVYFGQLFGEGIPKSLPWSLYDEWDWIAELIHDAKWAGRMYENA